MSKPVVILVSSNGPHAGKSTVSKMLLQNIRPKVLGRHIEIISFATPLKAMMYTLLTKGHGLSQEDAEERLYGGHKNWQIPGAPEGVTARTMLQKLGTEWRQEIGDPGLWRRLLLNKVLAAPGETPTFIVDDWRFEGELDYLQQSNKVRVYTLYVNSPDLSPQPANGHRSEGEIDPTRCDFYIHNEPQLGLEVLNSQVETIVSLLPR